jgi:hypothetical protein
MDYCITIVIFCLVGGLDLYFAILDFKRGHYFLGSALCMCALWVAINMFKFLVGC